MIKKTKHNKQPIISEIIRWIHYDPVLTRLFFNAVLPIPLFSCGLSGKDKVDVIVLGKGKPLSSGQVTLNHLYQQAARGFQFSMSKVLPLLVTSFVITDLVNYSRYPELRFGTTLKTVFSGFASNEQSISTRLFSNFPHETKIFWLGPGLMISLPILTLFGNVVVKALQRRYADAEDNKGTEVTNLKNLKHNPQIWYLYPALFSAAQAIIWNKDGVQKREILNEMLEVSKTSWLALGYLRQIVDSLNNDKKIKIKIKKITQNINRDQDEEDFLLEEDDSSEEKEMGWLDYALTELGKQRESTKNPLRAFYIDYLMYSIGHLPSNRKTPLTALALAFITALYLSINLYGHFRFVLTLYRKTKQFIDFLTQGGTCEYEGKQFTMRDFEYICGVCPEWPFVPKAETTTAQGCLDYLLKQAREPADLIKLMKKLFQSSSNSTEAVPQKNNTDINNVDVSERDWIKWPDQIFETFLDTLAQQKQYDQLNFSRPTEGNVWDDHNKLELLAGFLDKVAVKKIDGARLALGKGIKIVAKSLSNQTDMEYIDLNSNDIDDDAFDDIAPLFELPELNDVNLSKNSLSNDSLKKILPFANKSNVKKLDLSQNNLGVQVALDTLATLISQFKQLNWLNIGGQSFNGLDFTAFGNALLNSNVKSLNLNGASLGSLDFYYLSPYFKQLTHLNLSNNALDSQSLGFVMKGLSNGSLIELNVANNQLDDNALKVLANGVKLIPTITRLNLANNIFGRDGLKTLLTAINGPVDYLDLSNNSQNNAIDALIDWLNETTNVQIGELVLSNNQMPDSQGAALIKACSKHSINVLKLDYNALSSQTAQALHDSLSNGWEVTTLDLSNNRFNATDFKQINSALNVSQVTDLKFSNNAINNTQIVIEFSKELISPISDGRALGEEVVDPGLLKEIRGKQPETTLDNVELDNTGIDTSGTLALCRIQQANQTPHTLLTDNPAINKTIVDPQSCNIPNANANFTLPSRAKRYANHTTSTGKIAAQTKGSNYKASQLLMSQGIIFNKPHENEPNIQSQNSQRIAGTGMAVGAGAILGPTFFIVIGSVILIVGLAYALHFLNAWMNNTEPQHNHDDDKNFKF